MDDHFRQTKAANLKDFFFYFHFIFWTKVVIKGD